MNEERKKRFAELGIPQPTSMDGVTTQSVKNQDILLKLEQIKRGAKKADFKEIIQRTEGIKLQETNLKKNQNQPKTGFQVNNHVPLEDFKPAVSNNEALAIEKTLYGDVAPSAHMNENVDINNVYGNVQETNYKSVLEERLSQKYNSNSPYINNSLAAKQSSLQEEKIEKLIIEKATQVATEIAKKTVKQIIIEFAKSGKEILVESDRIKKAEIVSKDKVKINGKLYKLVEIKD